LNASRHWKTDPNPDDPQSMADESTLIAAIEQHESQAELHGALSEERTQALDYYRGEPMGNEVPGRSAVISRDVFDTVEWIKPDLAEIFCGGDEVVSFSPKSEEDVQGAEQETDYTNHVISQRNPWFMVFYNWSHDALLQKVGYVKAYWDDQEDVTKERYEDKSEEEYRKLQMDEELEELDCEEKVLGFDPVGQYVVKTYTCTFKRVKNVDVTRIENVPPENVRVAQKCRTLSLQDHRMPFVAHVEKKTISELRTEGFDVADDISDGGSSPGEWEGHKRDAYQSFMEANGDSPDPSMREVTVRECWIRHDHDGDGIAELRHVIVVGREILLNEETDIVNLVALCPNPQPHQHHGYSLADAVMDLQQIKTALWRNALDNQYLANNGRYGVDADNVNLDDMLDSRPGGIVRTKGDPRMAMMPLTHPTTGDIAIPMLEYTDRIGMKRTGVNEQTQGLDSNTINKNTPYATTAALMSAAQKRVRFIARIFAESGVKDLFLLVHAITLKHARKSDIVRLRNKFVPVDPRQWVKRSDMTVSVGLGTGDKPQQIAFLEKVFTIQGAVGPHGLASPQKVYNTLSKLTRAAGFKDPSEFWDDPSQTPPKPQGPPPEVLKEQVKGEVQMALADKKLQSEAAQAQLDAQVQRQNKQDELQVQAQNDQRDAQRQMLEAQLQQRAQVEEQRFQLMLQTMEQQQERWAAQLEASVKLQIAQMQDQRASETAHLNAQAKAESGQAANRD
jgi:hypothetical protein